MFDHLTPMNSKLICDLKEDPRKNSAWFLIVKCLFLINNGNNFCNMQYNSVIAISRFYFFKKIHLTYSKDISLHIF